MISTVSLGSSSSAVFVRRTSLSWILGTLGVDINSISLVAQCLIAKARECHLSPSLCQSTCSLSLLLVSSCALRAIASGAFICEELCLQHLVSFSLFGKPCVNVVLFCEEVSESDIHHLAVHPYWLYQLQIGLPSQCQKSLTVFAWYRIVRWVAAGLACPLCAASLLAHRQVHYLSHLRCRCVLTQHDVLLDGLLAHWLVELVKQHGQLFQGQSHACLFAHLS